jgi:Ca2+/Na+ antiporter
LGVVAVISPIIVVQTERLIVSGIFLLILFLLLPVLMRSNRKIERHEGVVLILLYLGFLLLEIFIK